MKRLFILAIYTTCVLFSAEAFLTTDMSVQRPVSVVRNTADEFTHFVEMARQCPFSSKPCSKIADQLIRFCMFEGHYVEANPDLVNQNACFKILLDDYSPLFSALQVLDRDQSNANVFFDCVLEIYTRNLKDQANLARMSLADDFKFGVPEKSSVWYETPGLDFFRCPTFLPNYERFISSLKIKGLSSSHTLVLRKKQKDLLSKKETQIEYRQCVEDYLNQLLHMAWMNLSNRNSLSDKTKAILANLPYIHKILKQGSQGGSFKYDLLITDFLTNPHNQLHDVFRIIDGSYVFVGEIPLPKILLPNKKRKKKTSASAYPVAPVVLPKALHQPDSDDGVVEEDDDLDATTTKQEALASVSTARTDLVKVLQPVLYQLADWQNGRAVVLRYDLCQFTNDQRKAFGLLQSLTDFNESKFVSYRMVKSLYEKLEGVIVNRKGSHETWEFNKGGNKVKTTFFMLHNEDQYGPWTKLAVQQAITDVLKPFLLQLES